MGYREEILTQLYRILEKNKADARIYYRLADTCNRSVLKYFFKKLSLQKRIFCRRVRYEIKELEKEIEHVGENHDLRISNTTKKSFTGLPSFRNDIFGLITYCYKREQQYLEIYKSLLSQTNLGNIREMLLSQKHSVQLAIHEIKALETRIQHGKNEEEINYS